MFASSQFTEPQQFTGSATSQSLPFPASEWFAQSTMQQKSTSVYEEVRSVNILLQQFQDAVYKQVVASLSPNSSPVRPGPNDGSMIESSAILAKPPMAKLWGVLSDYGTRLKNATGLSSSSLNSPSTNGLTASLSNLSSSHMSSEMDGGSDESPSSAPELSGQRNSSSSPQSQNVSPSRKTKQAKRNLREKIANMVCVHISSQGLSATVQSLNPSMADSAHVYAVVLTTETEGPDACTNLGICGNGNYMSRNASLNLLSKLENLLTSCGIAIDYSKHDLSNSKTFEMNYKSNGGLFKSSGVYFVDTPDSLFHQLINHFVHHVAFDPYTQLPGVITSRVIGDGDYSNGQRVNFSIDRGDSNVDSFMKQFAVNNDEQSANGRMQRLELEHGNIDQSDEMHDRNHMYDLHNDAMRAYSQNMFHQYAMEDNAVQTNAYTQPGNTAISTASMGARARIQEGKDASKFYASLYGELPQARSRTNGRSQNFL